MTYNLLKSIEEEVDRLDIQKVLDEKVRDNMSQALEGFIQDSIRKFIKGQTEHGGSLQDRNLELEIHNEVIDIFWYNTAKEWRPHK
jgi:hypothetical protein